MSYQVGGSGALFRRLDWHAGVQLPNPTRAFPYVKPQVFRFLLSKLVYFQAMFYLFCNDKTRIFCLQHLLITGILPLKMEVALTVPGGRW